MSEVAEFMFWGGLVLASISYMLLRIDRQLELRKQQNRLTDR